MKKVFKGTVFGPANQARPSKVELSLTAVRLAIAAGLAAVGSKVSVRVKVGKKRRLFKAVLREQVDFCCGEPSHRSVIGYFAERG